jgi:hypothetical protein
LILPQPQATALPALGWDESAPHFEAGGASGRFLAKALVHPSLNGFSCILPAFRRILSFIDVENFQIPTSTP